MRMLTVSLLHLMSFCFSQGRLARSRSVTQQFRVHEIPENAMAMDVEENSSGF